MVGHGEQERVASYFARGGQRTGPVAELPVAGGDELDLAPPAGGDLPVVGPDLIGVVAKHYEEPFDAHGDAGADRPLCQRQAEQPQRGLGDAVFVAREP